MSNTKDELLFLNPQENQDCEYLLKGFECFGELGDGFLVQHSICLVLLDRNGFLSQQILRARNNLGKGSHSLLQLRGLSFRGGCQLDQLKSERVIVFPKSLGALLLLANNGGLCFEILANLLESTP